MDSRTRCLKLTDLPSPTTPADQIRARLHVIGEKESMPAPNGANVAVCTSRLQFHTAPFPSAESETKPNTHLSVPSTLQDLQARIHWTPCKRAFVAYIHRLYRVEGARGWAVVGEIFSFVFFHDLFEAGFNDVLRPRIGFRCEATFRETMGEGSRKRAHPASAIYRVPFKDLRRRYRTFDEKLTGAIDTLHIQLTMRDEQSDGTTRRRYSRAYRDFPEPPSDDWDNPVAIELETGSLLPRRVPTTTTTSDPRVERAIRSKFGFPGTVKRLVDGEEITPLLWRGWSRSSYGINTPVSFRAGYFTVPGRCIDDPATINERCNEFKLDLWHHLDRENKTIATRFVSLTASFLWTLLKAVAQNILRKEEAYLTVIDAHGLADRTRLFSTGRQIQNLINTGPDHIKYSQHGSTLIKGVGRYRGVMEWVAYGQIESQTILSTVSVSRFRQLCESCSVVREFVQFDMIFHAVKTLEAHKQLRHIRQTLPNRSLDRTTGMAVGRLARLFCEGGERIRNISLLNPRVHELVRGFLQCWKVNCDLDRWSEDAQFVQSVSLGLEQLLETPLLSPDLDIDGGRLPQTLPLTPPDSQDTSIYHEPVSYSGNEGPSAWPVTSTQDSPCEARVARVKERRKEEEETGLRSRKRHRLVTIQRNCRHWFRGSLNDQRLTPVVEDDSDPDFEVDATMSEVEIKSSVAFDLERFRYQSPTPDDLSDREYARRPEMAGSSSSVMKPESVNAVANSVLLDELEAKRTDYLFNVESARNTLPYRPDPLKTRTAALTLFSNDGKYSYFSAQETPPPRTPWPHRPPQPSSLPSPPSPPSPPPSSHLFSVMPTSVHEEIPDVQERTADPAKDEKDEDLEIIDASQFRARRAVSEATIEESSFQGFDESDSVLQELNDWSANRVWSSPYT